MRIEISGRHRGNHGGSAGAALGMMRVPVASPRFKLEPRLHGMNIWEAMGVGFIVSVSIGMMAFWHF